MVYKQYPKVLVISHNVFDTTSNMGKTLAAFFCGWDKKNVAQLFFHSGKPDFDVCNRYFQITDVDLLKCFFNRLPVGRVVNKEDFNNFASQNNVEQKVFANIYKFSKRKQPYMYLLRNLLWRSNKWNTKELKKWIDDFGPDIVFYASGDYSFSIKVALKICESKNIPLVVYFGDEYYFYNKDKFSFINYINRKIYITDFRDMFLYLSSFITASDNMCKKYTGFFHKKGHAIMNSAEIGPNKNITQYMKISYIGNLGLNRWKPLVEIGECLKKMGLLLDVYSGENRQSVLENLKLSNGIQFHGPILADKVKEVIASSTIIIHVESMDKTNRQRTKYSMSTKIAESLGSGVCLFAYGPDDVSSIEYLDTNKAACVVTKKENLANKLEDILCNDIQRKKYVNNALKLAKKRHDFNVNSKLFYEIITEACNSKGSDYY